MDFQWVVTFLSLIGLSCYTISKLNGDIRRLRECLDERTAELANQLKAAETRADGAYQQPTDAAGKREALERVDQLGTRLFRHAPPLRRVLSLRIGLSRDFLRSKGITDGDLEGLEAQTAPGFFWPASEVVIEEWTTHTVITDFSGRRQVRYADPLPMVWTDPEIIWSHELPQRGTATIYGAKLEVVMFNDCIKVWAVDGHFGRPNPYEHHAYPEYTFVDIPTAESALEPCRFKRVKSEDPLTNPRDVPWQRTYTAGGPDNDFMWSLVVDDTVAFVRER